MLKHKCMLKCTSKKKHMKDVNIYIIDVEKIIIKVTIR